MNKKILMGLLIMGLTFFYLNTLVLKDNKVNKVISTEDYIVDELKNFIYNKFESIYNIKNIVINCDNVKDHIYSVKLIHTLKLKNIEEHPIIKAYEKFIKNNQISKNNKDFIEKQLKFWKENIYSYITTDQELNLRFKIEIIKNELRIYIEDPFCNYIDANKGIEIKNYDEIEDETYKNLIETFLNSNSKVPEVKLNYNPSSSVNYANTYTSNTTNQVWCGDIYVYQNTNYYNPNYYAYYCSDCANYVSQSVYAGGIPLDSTWYPYTSSWTYCPDLNTYMWSNYCYLTYYRPYAIPGSICMMDQNDNNNPDHTTLIVYNDGSILKYSAHTHDRKQYILPSSIQFPVWFLVFY